MVKSLIGELYIHLSFAPYVNIQMPSLVDLQQILYKMPKYHKLNCVTCVFFFYVFLMPWNVKPKDPGIPFRQGELILIHRGTMCLPAKLWCAREPVPDSKLSPRLCLSDLCP